VSTHVINHAEGQDCYGDGHAEFSRFVCWYPDRVSAVMNTEALSTPPEVFLATHSPMPLYRGELSSRDGETVLRDYSENQFLDDFLAPEDFSFVAVLGGAGTGKSHLVRWIATRLQEKKGRRVLLIPRAGTSLHAILRLILKDIEGERFDEYRKRLATATTALSLVEARVRLLENLAIAVGNTDSVEGTVTDEQEYLSAELPHLLRDPIFRVHFLEPGGILDRLSRHVVGGGGIERVEERRSFSTRDLPLSFVKATEASRPAQEIYRNLVANPDLKESAVAWINRHLDAAVSQLMRMSGTDLLRLMLDVRAQLAVDQVELIILIEDLATLQGIDQQLLEALIIRPRQQDMPELCRLRTVVAMTSGYYHGLKTNVHQRFDFRVVMGESDTRGELSGTALDRFTARYLNATRLRGDELVKWHGEMPATEGADIDRVPNPCHVCKFRPECHTAFGEFDGIGLYPFSSIAATNIAARINPGGFNPRTQLKEGYKPILENYADALHEGDFPPPELLARLGKSRLDTVTVSLIQQSDPVNRFRRAVLLDLWSHGSTLHDLDPIIHQAFDIAPVGITADKKAIQKTDKEKKKDEPNKRKGEGEHANAAELKLHDHIAKIDEWRAGGAMSQELAQSLREVVFPAVVTHVDWNALHLIPGEFVGVGKGFRQANSIVFERQILAGGQAPIQLRIPQPNEDPIEPALALQGLLRFRHYRSWDFDDGLKYYRAYARQVDLWGQVVVGQINRLTESQHVWNPVPSGVELLAIGARVFGRPKAREPDRQELVDALFVTLPDRDDRDRVESWQQLTKVIAKHHDNVRELVLSRIACSKGDSRKLQVIDVSQTLPTLSRVRRSWIPEEQIPADLVKSVRFVLDYREGLDELLQRAISDEQAKQAHQYEEIVEQLGGDILSPATVVDRRKPVIEALRRAIYAAAHAGVLSGVNKMVFEEKLTEFEGVQIQAWSESVSRILLEKDIGNLLTDLSLIPMSTVRVTLEMLELADRFLSRTEAAIRQEISSTHGDGARELDDVQESISNDLEGLVEALTALNPPQVQL
jgi:hypothetical protein